MASTDIRHVRGVISDQCCKRAPVYGQGAQQNAHHCKNCVKNCAFWCPHLSRPHLALLEFLQWTLDDCRLSWKKGELAWVNLHVGMYFYPTSPKYPIDPFRCLAACSISADPALPARFCCWTCRQPGEGGSVKSLWPSFTSYSWHWNLTHARQLYKDWVSLALHGGVTLHDLAWSLLGVDLDDTPLPYHKDALRHLPRTLPPREQGHNPKIYGHPWNIERPFTPPHRALPAGPSHITPTPPSHPPPSHVLPSLGQPLVAVNKSLASLTSTFEVSSTSCTYRSHFEKFIQCHCFTLFTSLSCHHQRSRLPVPDWTGCQRFCQDWLGKPIDSLGFPLG